VTQPNWRSRNALEKVLRLLVERHFAERERAKAHDLLLIEKVGERMQPAAGSDVSRYIRAHDERGDTSEWGLYFFLELVHDTGPLLPVVTVSYDFVNGSLQIRVGLFSLREVANGHRLRAVGYRFESPENTPYGGEGETEIGAHDYYHAQPIMRLVKALPRSALGDSEARWVPESQPAFPLEAENALQLLACTLVTIYGRRHVASPDFAEVRNCFSKEAAELRCVNRPAR
jgi:hypothetical protein